jgi:uncharacterized protein YqgC (DUF456 family)
MIWLYYLLLVTVQFVGLALTLLTLPGLWLMVAAAAVYSWLTGGAYLGVYVLAALLAMALAAEFLEFIAGSYGARAAGGSKRSMLGAAVGAILGAIFLSFLIPVPVLGTLVGVCVGAFLGAAGAQVTKQGDVAHSVQVGVGAAKGRFLGVVIKLAFGAVMFLLIVWQAIPVGAPPAALPTTRPTMAPAPLPATLPQTQP